MNVPKNVTNFKIYIYPSLHINPTMVVRMLLVVFVFHAVFKWIVATRFWKLLTGKKNTQKKVQHFLLSFLIVARHFLRKEFRSCFLSVLQGICGPTKDYFCHTLTTCVLNVTKNSWYCICSWRINLLNWTLIAWSHTDLVNSF